MPERYGHPQLQAIVCSLSTKYNLTVLCCLCIENDPHGVLRGPQVVQASSRLAKLLDTRRLRDRRASAMLKILITPLSIIMEKRLHLA